MTNPKGIIPYHPQSRLHSCVPWGTEIILLSFGKRIPTPSFQERNGFGFVEAKKALIDEGINSYDHAFGLDFDGFVSAMLAAIKTGVYPAVIMPEFYFYDEGKQGLGLASHTYVVGANGSHLEFLTLRETGMAVYSEPQFRKRWECWANNVTQKQLLLHTLVPVP